MFEWLFNSIRGVCVCVYMHARAYVHEVEVDACVHACVGFIFYVFVRHTLTHRHTDTHRHRTQTCECGLCLVWPLYLALLLRLTLCSPPIP